MESLKQENKSHNSIIIENQNTELLSKPNWGGDIVDITFMVEKHECIFQ